jgi:exopolyphosphatase/guanosine-5'-triphosphate,3'-diphosphate pyrophosphatase
VDSLEMGCVGFSRRFFPGGAVRRPRWRDAVLAARLEVRPVANRFLRRGWSHAAGASGTVRTVEQLLRAKGWSAGGITADGLRRLEEELLSAGHVDRADLPGVKEDRLPVLAGGVAILSAVFEGLRIERLDACTGALREGVLYDLMGRLQHEDVRERTIAAFQDRYHVDRDQASRVESTALGLLAEVAGAWGIDPEEGARSLSWSSRLHEIGLALSFEGHHRHAAYLVANSDMPGFSSDDQTLLSVLLATHRRKVRRADFRELPERTREMAVRLSALQRLAVRLHRGRGADPLPTILVRAAPDGLAIALPPGWLDRNPLTRADLETESGRVKSLGLRLEICETTDAAEPVPA